MKKIFKIGSLVLALVLVLAMMTGCGKPAAQTETSAPEASSVETPTEAETITVVVPRHELDNIGLIEGYVRQFEEEYGIKVELINASWDVCTDKIRTELSVGGTAYDVIDFDNSLVAMYIENDWLEPLDGYEGAEEMKNSIVPGLVDKFSVDGTLYGIAWNNDTHVYMYNARMLEEGGITEIPKTWDEIVEASKILIEKGICKYGMPACFWGNGAVNEMTNILYSFGGNAFDENGNLCIGTDPNTLEAFKYVKMMMDEGIIDPASLTYDYEAANNVFLAGDSAFFVQAIAGLFANSNDPAQSQVVGEIQVAPFTVTNSKDTEVVLTVPEAYAIPKNSQHKEAAWKFIQFMATKEFDKTKALELGALPIYEENFNDPDVLAKYPHFEQMGKQIPHAKGIDDFTWYDEYSNVFQSELQSMLMGEITPEECVANIQEQCAQFAK